MNAGGSPSGREALKDAQELERQIVQTSMDLKRAREKKTLLAEKVTDAQGKLEVIDGQYAIAERELRKINRLVSAAKEEEVPAKAPAKVPAKETKVSKTVPKKEKPSGIKPAKVASLPKPAKPVKQKPKEKKELVKGSQKKKSARELKREAKKKRKEQRRLEKIAARAKRKSERESKKKAKQLAKASLRAKKKSAKKTIPAKSKATDRAALEAELLEFADISDVEETTPTKSVKGKTVLSKPQKRDGAKTPIETKSAKKVEIPPSKGKKVEEREIFDPGSLSSEIQRVKYKRAVGDAEKANVTIKKYKAQIEELNRLKNEAEEILQAEIRKTSSTKDPNAKKSLLKNQQEAQRKVDNYKGLLASYQNRLEKAEKESLELQAKIKTLEEEMPGLAEFVKEKPIVEKPPKIVKAEIKSEPIDQKKTRKNKFVWRKRD